MYIDQYYKGYRMFEVPPDAELRAGLKESLEELTEILKTFRKLHNITDIDTRKRVIRAIELNTITGTPIRSRKSSRNLDR